MTYAWHVVTKMNCPGCVMLISTLAPEFEDPPWRGINCPFCQKSFVTPSGRLSKGTATDPRENAPRTSKTRCDRRCHQQIDWVASGTRKHLRSHAPGFQWLVLGVLSLPSRVRRMEGPIPACELGSVLTKYLPLSQSTYPLSEGIYLAGSPFQSSGERIVQCNEVRESAVCASTFNQCHSGWQTD
ncbi:hypothetical protein N7492_009146 [Penicillium capsulatum]|uniref:Uncharacterized protein n=1 Tax=Penicillium capsulatum TaxID=69766 RepID=A0A9W9LHM0_9EURO|nr:hypothetical protein N7492_009146 [Penicillium capsulatum]KAJ6106545.1 hypothetical protein N7512_010062 [Penicillium capsulatum]